jgi:hypothetical protein
MADAVTQVLPQTSVAAARPALDRGFDPRTAIASPEERKALLALAESVPGVVRVCDEMISAY